MTGTKKKRTIAKKRPATSAKKKLPAATGFDAGKMGRRLRAIPPSRTAINSLIRTYGKNVVARSRYMCANDPYASSAKEEFVAYMIGTGIIPSSMVEDAGMKEAIQDAFLTWTDEADADGNTDFYGLQSVVAAELFEGGECFLRFRNRLASDGLSVPLQIQVLPTEMLPTEYNMVLGNGRRIECGIQFDAIGRREGYWFYTQHPGETFNASVLALKQQLVFVPASEVLHLFRPIRAGQIRGIPQTVSGIATLAAHHLYDDAELERKRTAALFGAFVTQGLNATDDDDANPLTGAPTREHNGDPANIQVDYAMEPGATISLDYGQDIRFAEPADVGGNYEAFQNRMLMKAAAGFGVTYHGMTGDTGNANYSSMRSDQLRFRRRIEAQQNHIIIFQMCLKVWKRWLDAAVLAGAIPNLSARDYLANKSTIQKVKWTPPKWDWVDPLKDITAEKLAVDSGFKPRSAVIEGLGEVPEQTDKTILSDQQRAEKLGIKFTALKTGLLVSPSSEEPPQPPASQPLGNQPQPQPGGNNG